MPTVTCSVCKRAVSAEAKFCSNCGQIATKPASPSKFVKVAGAIGAAVLTLVVFFVVSAANRHSSRGSYEITPDEQRKIEEKAAKDAAEDATKNVRREVEAGALKKR